MKVLLSFLLIFCSAGFTQAVKDPISEAMKEELSRNFEKLKNAEETPLYFLQYQLWSEKSYWVSANLGAIVSQNDYFNNVASVDSRIGSAALDNTHEIKGRESNDWDANAKDIDSDMTPLTDKDAIKAKFWLLTDSSYKSAMNKYSKVKANKGVTAGEEDNSGDFSLEKSTDVFYNPAEEVKINKEYISSLLKELSMEFKSHEFILYSGINFSYTNENRYMVNSDGADIVDGNNYISLSYSLSARTTDGMDLSRYRSYNFENMDKFPSKEEIKKDIVASVDELKKLVSAKIQEPFTGPAILESRAAGVFWHEILGHRLEGHRQKSESEGQTFAKKIGEKIMPEFLTIYDDPNMRYFNGTFLRGFYKYDDEAMRAQRANLVDKGVLKGFLMQRVPLEKFPYSNGHGRRSDGNMTVARQANLIIESSDSVSYEELRKKLIEEIKKANKPYGLIIRDIAGGFTITGRSLPQSYTILIKYALRVYPDGRPDEPIRGLNMIGTPLQTFQKIIGTAKDDDVFNGTCGAESGWVPVSAVSPSLLFSEIETEKVEKSNEMPPILKPPFFDKK